MLSLRNFFHAKLREVMLSGISSKKTQDEIILWDVKLLEATPRVHLKLLQKMSCCVKLTCSELFKSVNGLTDKTNKNDRLIRLLAVACSLKYKNMGDNFILKLHLNIVTSMIS